MADKQTEQSHARGQGLDVLPDLEILDILAAAQAAAAASVAHAAPALARAADLATASLQAGGRLIYAAAGSSGLMALADGLELPGTFGIAREQIVVLLAGGSASLADMRGGPEDDAEAAVQAVAALAPGKHDCLIALTASGHTPYAVAAARTAARSGSRTIGIANNAGAELFGVVDVPVFLPSPAEVIAGSTRMGAGTAQKIALNMFSTLMAIRLGHVHDGLMVNVVADNAKLRQRAHSIVRSITGVDEDRANAALAQSGGQVKLAVLVAGGAKDLAAAEQLLTQYHGHLRPALKALADQ